MTPHGLSHRAEKWWRGDAIDTDTEKVVNARGLQELLTARAQRVDRRGDRGVE
jgi:hypothetical protein